MNHIYEPEDVRALVRQRMHEQAEPVCDCGAPTAKDCECPDEAHEVDSDETLGLRR